MQAQHAFRIAMVSLCGLVVLALVGCIPIPFIYPNLTYVPPLEMKSDDPVYVFREDKIDGGQTILVSGYIKRGGSVDLVAVSENQQIEAQTGCYWNRGLVWWPFYAYADTRSTVIRLYRPCYHTVELSGWVKGKNINWTKATDLAAQENNLDALWSCGSGDWESDPPNYWNRGGISSRAREFLAGEYERLAREQEQLLTPDESETSAGFLRLQRLSRKANWLRQQAE